MRRILALINNSMNSYKIIKVISITLLSPILLMALIPYTLMAFALSDDWKEFRESFNF